MDMFAVTREPWMISINSIIIQNSKMKRLHWPFEQVAMWKARRSPIGILTRREEITWIIW